MPVACPLCAGDGGELLWRRGPVRLVLPSDGPEGIPVVRVIWAEHRAEMTDLTPPEQAALLAGVWLAERLLREGLGAEKINLASLGNVVPHLHWHVLARFADDAWFPDPVWAPKRRAGQSRHLDPASGRAWLAREA